MKYPLSIVANREMGNRRNFLCDMMETTYVHITCIDSHAWFFRINNDAISPLMGQEGTLIETSRALAEKNTCQSSLGICLARNRRLK